MSALKISIIYDITLIQSTDICENVTIIEGDVRRNGIMRLSIHIEAGEKCVCKKYRLERIFSAFD